MESKYKVIIVPINDFMNNRKNELEQYENFTILKIDTLFDQYNIPCQYYILIERNDK